MRIAPAREAGAAVTSGGAIVWLTGYSGAGKSTLSAALAPRLQSAGQRVEVLDGDEVRTHLTSGLGFSRADRDTNVRRIGYVAHLLQRNGVFVITAAISPYRETRAWVRALAPHAFVEVFVNAPIETCIARDVKGLYKKALAGEIQNFTGVSDPYEPPERPDVEVRTDRSTLDRCAEAVIETLCARGLLAGEPTMQTTTTASM